MRRFGFFAVVTVAGILACDRAPIGGRSASESDYSAIAIRHYGPGGVALDGLSPDDMKRVRNAQLKPEEWQRLLRFSVAGSDSIAIAGRYSLRDNAIEFTPLFPFDAGREYNLRLDASAAPLNRAGGGWAASFTVATEANNAPATAVLRILPSGDNWLENQLRIYVEFSAPMSRTMGLHHITLSDDKGREVKQAFLPLEADFWNHDATRYTFFFDPGRVKRGILPNEQMGPPLTTGRRYTLVIDSLWKDSFGRTLAGSFDRSFRVVPPDHEKIAIAAWTVRAPARSAREPLIVSFPKQLDHGLLLRALGVETARGVAVSGEGSVEQGEIEWRFTPRDAWRPGEYQLLILSILEDGAGNRIDRPFEVDKFERVDSVATPERYTIKFVVK